MYSQFMLYGQKHIVLPFMSAATLKPIRLECCLPATADCLPPTKWVCFESTVWPDTCRSVHRIRVINGNVWHLLPCLKSVQTVVRRFWFYLLPCLKSVQTVVLRRFWFYFLVWSLSRLLCCVNSGSTSLSEVCPDCCVASILVPT